MKTILNNLLFLLLLLALLQSCKKGDCLESAGAITIVNRPISSFNQIDLNDNVNLILTQDTIERIQVEAGQNLQPNILTTVTNNILTIKNTTSCQWLRNPSEKINVYISVKKLNTVNYNGSGNVTSTNTITTDNITFNSNEGAGNVEVTLDAQQTFAYIYHENADFIFHGKSNYCASYTNSRGSIDFKDFIVKNMNIEYGSIRDTHINVTETLHAIVYFKGSIYYTGSPAKIDTTYYSSGRLIHLP